MRGALERKQAMLAVDDLAFGIGARRVGSDVTFALDPGETLAVLGGNGAGKTTLFRTLLGLLPAQAGSVLVNGDRVDALAPPERAKRLAYVPQQHVPAFGFTVVESVLMGRASRLSTFARPGAADRAAAFGALQRLGIGSLSGRPVTELSGGERQLVLVARALAQEAPVLILDEPTASLDFGNRARVLREIDRLRSAGMTIMFSTHEPDHALAHADRALLLADGRTLALDTVERALTAENIARLYRTPVRLVPLGERRYACVASEVEARE
jgi:iron complex transport system ATP-binding protein